MNITFLDPKEFTNIDKLTTVQMILMFELQAKNTTVFSHKVNKHFGKNHGTRDHFLLELITEITDFENGVTFNQYTNTTCGRLIKPFNYTMKPFLANTGRGAEFLITSLSENDKSYLSTLKNKLWSLTLNIY